MTALTASQTQRLRDALIERSRALGAQVREVESERSEDLAQAAGDTVGDMGDHGEHLTRDVLRQAESKRDVAELREIDAALSRIDEGSYGVCEDCGVAIALPRLLVQPAAARCIECQERVERRRPEGGGG